MSLSEYDWPRAHLVLDSFFSPPALAAIFRDLPSIERRMKPGLVRDIGHDGQSVFFEHERRQNRAVWIHDPARPLRLFRAQLWSERMIEAFGEAREPLFQIIPNCWAPHLQVSSYMTGDHYDFHMDEGAGVNLTAIVFLASDPKKVKGGDLVLSYGGEETTIRFRHNRLVVFPSKTLHRVTPVRVASDDRKHARISLQCWLTFGKPPKAAKRRPRLVEDRADRPTFLLADEPIVAAAQALIDSGAEQEPEELYWGAFYLSRILSSNLRFLIAEQGDLEVGPVRIVRPSGGGLEVFASGRLARGGKVRVGFRLRGRQTNPAEALSLFVEPEGSKRAASSHVSHVSVVPPNTDERKTVAILRRLLVRAGGSTSK